MTVDELKTEHVRLVQQMIAIEKAEHAGVANKIKFDGKDYTFAEATELTRAAIYQVELKLREAGVYG